MRVLTWNIAFLPRNINILRNPNKVLYNIVDNILKKEADVINLQELFDYSLQEQINQILKYNNYNTYYSKKKGFISKNGLLTASKHDIINKKDMEFDNYTGPEKLIKKGLISIETQNYIVHNTHLQSDGLGTLYKKFSKKYREKQFQEMNNYLKNFNHKKLNILCGDLNENFENEILKNFITDDSNFYFKLNENKIITFPKTQEQLDYIIFNKDKQIKYYVDKNDYSDHNILICDVEKFKNTNINKLNKEINNILANH